MVGFGGVDLPSLTGRTNVGRDPTLPFEPFPTVRPQLVNAAIGSGWTVDMLLAGVTPGLSYLFRLYDRKNEMATRVAMVTATQHQTSIP